MGKLRKQNKNWQSKDSNFEMIVTRQILFHENIAVVQRICLEMLVVAKCLVVHCQYTVKSTVLIDAFLIIH